MGGFERVYEINRNFRNEGSAHGTTRVHHLRVLLAYATYQDMMDLTESCFPYRPRRVRRHARDLQEQEIDLTPAPGRASPSTTPGKDRRRGPEVYRDYDAPAPWCAARAKRCQGEVLGKVQAKLFDLFVEPKLIQPHFIYMYPTDISPLSRRNDANPELSDRYELFIAGREMANAFSELNDPVDQRLSFEAQVAEKAAGDAEAHAMDEDYVRALEYGMPPAAGQGVGIDRLVMLLTDSPSIREVILFPLLKPEGGASA